MNPICPLTLLSGVSGDSIQPCILAYLTRNYFYVAAAAVCQTASAVTQCVSQLIHITTRGQNQLIIYLYGRIFFYIKLAIAFSVSRASRPDTFDSHCLTHATNYVTNYFLNMFLHEHYTYCSNLTIYRVLFNLQGIFSLLCTFTQPTVLCHPLV